MKRDLVDETIVWRTFEEGEEVILRDAEAHEPKDTTTGLVYSVDGDRIGVRWFGVGGRWVHYYRKQDLDKLISRDELPGR